MRRPRERPAALLGLVVLASPAVGAPWDRRVAAPVRKAGATPHSSPGPDRTPARGYRLDAEVKPGRKGLRFGGLILASVGPSVILGGVIWLVLQGSDLNKDIDEMGNLVEGPKPSPAGPAALIAIGSAMLVGGVVMAILGKTRYKLVPRNGVGFLRPLRF